MSKRRILLTFGQLQRQIQELQEMAAERRTLQEMIEKLYDIFGNPAYLVDTSFKILAIDRRHSMRELSRTWRRAEDDGYLPLNLVSDWTGSQEIDAIEAQVTSRWIHSPHFYTPFINCNLRYHGVLQGHLFIVTMFRKEATPGDLELADAAAKIIWQAMKNNDLYQHRRGFLYENFMKDLFSGKIRELSYIRQQIRYLNLEENSLFFIGKIQLDSAEETVVERTASLIERTFDVRLAKYHDYLMGMFLLCQRENMDIAAAKLKQLAGNSHLRIGLSDLADNILDIPLCATQAVTALKLCGDLAHSVYNNHDYSLSDLLSIPEERKAVFCPPELRAFLQQDTPNAEEYVQTLYCYLENECGIQKTADALHIHRNTLTYRLDRLRDAYHILLDDPGYKRRYYLSLKMRLQKGA